MTLCALLIGTEKIGLDLLGLPGGVTGMREEELSELFSNKYDESDLFDRFKY